MVSKYLKISLIAVIILGVLVPVIYFSFIQNSSREIEIDLWYTYEGGDVISAKVQSYMDSHPQVQINFIEQPSSGWLDKFISVAQTGESPDIFLGKGSWLGELAKLGYIHSLTNYITPEDESKFFSSAIEGMAYMGEYWGLPLWYDSILLFYNKDLFDAQNVSYPLMNWTDVEFIDAAIDLTDRTEEQQIYGLVWATLSPYMWPAFQFGFDHGPLYQDEMITVNDTASYNAMDFIYDLKYNKRVVKYDDTSGSATQAFITNKGAMLIYGGWYIPMLEDLGINYGIQVLPSISSTGERITPLVEVKGWGISKDTEHSDTCYDIIKFLSSKDVQEEMIEKEFKVPTLVELLNSPLVKNDPRISIQLEQIEFSQLLPLDPIYNYYSDYMRAALQFILLDHLDIQTSLDDAQSGINSNVEGT
ncbi:MAG: extracellular solute-binding protein [Candidatus Heimdallarchaeota archaeon]|nr:extracellular solute-binding protein [Candidatus Heimdallarchaeota archaeon]